VKQIEQLTELLRVQVCIDYFLENQVAQCLVSCVLVRDPQVWKLNNNGWTGHGMVYFSNVTFQLAWTLGIYVWLVCSAKFPAKKISANFVSGPCNFFVRKLRILFCFSDTRCLDALFETKCFINLSCGYRNLTKSINDSNQLRLLKKHYF